jgi:hypothetical protein
MKLISPAYTHSLIEAGDEIEALKILGKHQPGEPACYDCSPPFRQQFLHADFVQNRCAGFPKKPLPL